MSEGRVPRLGRPSGRAVPGPHADRHAQPESGRQARTVAQLMADHVRLRSERMTLARARGVGLGRVLASVTVLLQLGCAGNDPRPAAASETLEGGGGRTPGTFVRVIDAGRSDDG